MIYLNIPIIIVGTFLLLTLVVGIYFSRKKTTFREYAVGNKDFSTATLVATVLATNFGAAGLVRNVQQVYCMGLYWIVIYLFIIFRLWNMGWLAIRMKPFMNHLSMTETIGSVYGKYPRVITALISICKSIILITSQIIVTAEFIAICVGFSGSCVTVLATLLLIFYSTFGGVRAITFTDVLQFVTFTIIIPLIGWFVFVKAGKPISELFPILKSHDKFKFINLFHFDVKLVNMGAILLCCLTPCIEPSMVHKIHMSSDPIQAKKVFSYAAICSFFIRTFIILIGLFVFMGTPELTKKDVWDYIMTHMPPVFKGFFAISLLAMAMSTVDSELNSCSIMVSHDMLESILNVKKDSYPYQLRLARLTTIVVGLSAMTIAFYCKDLLKLMFWTLDLDVIVVAPFILIIFGFRGTSRTALLGMTTGALAIFAWNKWIKSIIEVNGAFTCMLINILTMLGAHYLLKQPKSSGWVKPDNVFKQIQQEKDRRRAERKEAIKNAWENKIFSFAKLVPSYTTMVCVGFYLFITSLLDYFIAPITNHSFWLILQLFGSACCLGYPFLYDISKKIRSIPSWFIGLSWLMGLVIYLPLNVLWNWWYAVDPIFSISLSLAHLSVILWVLPLYLGIGVIAVTSLVAIYPIYIGLSYPVLYSLFPLFMVSLLIFSMVIWFKVRVSNLTTQNSYLKDQEEIRESQKLKASLYEAALVPSNGTATSKGYGFILKQVVRKVEESISFLDNHTPLFKEDLQSIINKFYDWVDYFNRKEKAKKHALLQPTKITLDKLIRKIEINLSQQMNAPPRLLVEKISAPNQEPSLNIVCDINQVVYSLAKAVLRLDKPEGTNPPIVKVQLHPTALKFKQVDSIDYDCPVFMDFQAIAIVISQDTTDSKPLPKVKECYDEIDAMGSQVEEDTPPSIDLEQDTITSMVHAHYGYLEVSNDKKQPTMLLVLPMDVTDILDKMTVKLPIDSLTIESPVTPKEQADSMMELMKFHDYVCKSLCQDDPIDVKIISGLLLLLRERFKFKRHESGQLFYVRAVGIAKLVVDWVFHSPKVVYASLLYGLVRRTCLPLSYIKQHYNLGVYAFVSNVVKIDKREELDHPSLLCVPNRLEQAIKEEHIQLSVLFIKLAERLYDLRHAAGYIHLTEVKHMAQETLTIDVQIAQKYLGPEIAQSLEEAAKQAIEVCNSKEKEKNS